MSTVEELLTYPDIANWLQTHQGSAGEVRRAAEILAGKPDDIAGLRSLLPALSERAVSVFFSYKAKDERAAKAVVGLLRKFSAGKLKITYQAEFTRGITGRPWRQRIKEAVCHANWFILLLPDPSDDWDWCLYETGLFDRQATSADRVICLHHPATEIPDPIKDYHAVPATKPKVEEFLRMVYLEDDPIPGLPAINKDAADEIPNLAARIVEAFHAPRKGLCRRIYEPWVELSLPAADRLEDKEGLDAATVESANREALSLFDFDEQPATFAELRSSIQEPEGDARWREELFDVIRRIAQKRLFQPIQAVFQAPNGKIYRPVLCAIDRVGQAGSIHSFHVTFTEDVGAIDNTAIPPEISSLATVLRFVFRFRWEVLEKFSKGPMVDEDVERLDNAFQRMIQDWESRGIGDAAKIVGLFRPAQRQRVVEMMTDWAKVRNPEGTGALDVAIEARDPGPIPDILRRFIPMNQEFLEMAAERFSELVSGKP